MGANRIRSEEMRVFDSPSLTAPQVQLFSNGRYHLMVSSAGGGYSRWRDLAVTRWREDSTRDCWGTFVYLRNASTGEFWSAPPHPPLQRAKLHAAIFTRGRRDLRVRHDGMETHTDISVSPEDD